MSEEESSDIMNQMMQHFEEAREEREAELERAQAGGWDSEDEYQYQQYLQQGREETRLWRMEMERLHDEQEEEDRQALQRLVREEERKKRTIRKRKEKSYRLALQNAMRSPRFRVNTLEGLKRAMKEAHEQGRENRIKDRRARQAKRRE